MPTVRPFRALRYDPAAGELATLISPPYDVISPAEQARLLARHPRNSVRLDLPPELPGDARGERYVRAAAELGTWQREGTLRLDPDPALYVYEQAFRVPGRDATRVQQGIFARLSLEPFETGGTILPHEWTMGGPKADRLEVLRATGASLSPIVGLYASPGGATGPLLEELMRGRPTAEACDDDGVRHRLWVVPESASATAPTIQAMLEAASSGPITIADGHHRYETALAYHAERPEADTILALLVDTAASGITILPTHRIVRSQPSGAALLAAAGELFEVEPLSSVEALLATMASAPSAQRFGVATESASAVLRPRREAIAPLLDAGASAVLRWLDVSVLGAALERLFGIDRQAVADGRLGYEKDARAAVETVQRGDADTAFLLDATPLASVLAVAKAGERMPQKSTYFYPKPATGLVFDIGAPRDGHA